MPQTAYDRNRHRPPLGGRRRGCSCRRDSTELVGVQERSSSICRLRTDDFSHPDVAERDGTAMVLQRNGQPIGMRLVFWLTSISRRSTQRNVVLNEDSVVKKS